MTASDCLTDTYCGGGAYTTHAMIAAAQQLLLLRVLYPRGFLPPTRTNINAKRTTSFFYLYIYFRNETSPLEKRIVGRKKPRILPREGPRSAIDSTIIMVAAVAVKRVLTLQATGHPFSYTAGFRGPCTLSRHCRLS